MGLLFRIPSVIGYGLWDWGANFYGQLGQLPLTAVNAGTSSPTQVGNLTTWTQVAVGTFHTVALKLDGTLWTWGYNTDGELGDGTSVEKSSPVQIGGLTNWASISAGNSHSVAVKTDGTLWNWGYFMAMGNGTPLTNHSSPSQVGALTNWKVVAGGDQCSLAVKNDGTLWGWGDDTYGQLGDGNHSVTYSSPIQIGSATNWKTLSLGIGYQATAAIKTDGTLWTWGRNGYYQLGNGNNTDMYLPVQVGSLTTWSAVSVGESHVMAIKTDGTLWGWGKGIYGELGNTGIAQYSTPVQVGAATNWSSVAAGFYGTIATKTDGTLWAWGRDATDNYAITTFGSTVSTPVQVGVSTGWSSVQAGYQHVVALHS